MTRAATILYRTRGCAPWLTVLTLCALASALPNRLSTDEDGSHRRAEIAQALEDAPYFIGDWIGSDAAVPQEAQKLLRPNAILSRSYQSGDGVLVHLLIIHCSDARDMIGHYPPICYPSSGYVAVSTPGVGTVVLNANGTPMPTKMYAFARAREFGEMDEIRVLNAFILPSGRITSEIRDVHRQSERLTGSARGVAQVQVIAALGVPQEQVVEAVNELLAGMPDLLEALCLEAVRHCDAKGLVTPTRE